MKYSAMVDGERVEIELSRTGGDSIEADLNGRKYVLEARPVEPGVYWLNLGNQSIEVTITQNSDGYVVSIGGKRIPVEMIDARTALRRAAQQGYAGLIEIRAPMPGKIVKVLVSEGAGVSANQGLIVMEAMKMQNEIKSPKNGVVKKLGVREGAAVSSGDVLAVVE